MAIEIKLREIDDVTIIDCIGEITLGEFGTRCLRDTTKQLIVSGKKKVILNLAQTTYTDSSGISEIVSSFTNIANNGGKFKLLFIHKKLKEVLQITKLLNVFEVFENEDEAIKSFK